MCITSSCTTLNVSSSSGCFFDTSLGMKCFFFFVALVLTRLHRHLELSWGVITQTLIPLRMELVARDVPGQHVAHSSKAEMSE